MKMDDWFNPRAVAVLLFVGAAVYAVGAVAETSVVSQPATNPVVATSPPATSAGETGNEGTEHSSTGTAPAKTESVGGLNPEAPIFVVPAILVFAGLGLAAWLRPGGVVLIAATLVALLATVLDIREVVHQLGEGRGLLVGIAAVLIVIHLATAGTGAGAARRVSTPVR